MTAGVPGLGLSGLFVLICAVVMPLRAARRHEPAAHPVRPLGMLGIAAVIIAAVWLTWLTASSVVQRVSTGDGRHQAGPLGEFFGLPLVVVSLAILATVLLGAELASHIVATRPTPTDPPVRTQRCTPDDGEAQSGRPRSSS